jgi:hypothetical protein
VYRKQLRSSDLAWLTHCRKAMMSFSFLLCENAHWPSGSNLQTTYSARQIFLSAKASESVNIHAANDKGDIVI